MKRLEIGTTDDGKQLLLPAVETTTQTITIFGGRGMGKTNVGSVLCEELAAAGQRFCYLDPMGVAWGIRHSADGKGEGLPILILGGRHGDLPIEPTGGAVVADFVARARENVLIDISSAHDGRRWSQGQKIRFAADYFTRLLEVQGEHRRPLMQVVDEAARFAPQVIEFKDPDVARCKVSLEVLLEEGRNAGVGVTLLTQRSARIAKSVTELAELMIAFRIIGPNSTQAVLDWFGAHVAKARHNELLEQLRKLPRGTALVVSPGWLDFEGVAAIRLRHTFDSSKTPTGTEAKLAKRVRPHDLEKLREAIASTIEKAEAEDPKKIREAFRTKLAEAERAARESNARVGVLEAKVAQLQERPAPAAKDARLRAKDREQLEAIAKRTEAAVRALQEAAPGLLKKIEAIFGKASAEIGAAVNKPDFVALMHAIQHGAPAAGGTPAPAPRAIAPAPPPRAVAAAAKPKPPKTPPPPADVDGINSYQLDVLAAIAKLHALGVEAPNKLLVGGLAKKSPRSSTWDGNVAGLVKRGLAVYESGGIRATPAGLALVPDQGAADGADILAGYRSILSKYQLALFDGLVANARDNGNDPIDRDTWASLSNVSAGSSTFDNEAASLRKMGVADVGKGTVRLAARLAAYV